MPPTSPKTATLADLIALAIQSEQKNEALYRALAEKFARSPEAAAFWQRYAEEEVAHTRWLQGLQERAGADRLAAAAAEPVMEQARQVSSVTIAPLLAQVRTLQDAYDLANELEHSETNVIFDFLIGQFAQDQSSMVFLRAQLTEHVARLVNDFPAAYREAAVRQAVRAE